MSNDLPPRTARAGSSVQDLCRSCKLVRSHTVMAASPDGTIQRVVCDYCRSQHNYRGGEQAAGPRRDSTPSRSTERTVFPVVSDRERSAPPMSLDGTEAATEDLELLLRRVIREEAGLSPVTPAAKWHGGDLILRPGNPELQEKSLPIETFFSKIVMVRNRLRMIEQQINSTELPTAVKTKLQGYITGCYGSLTSFNVLFAEEEDRFRGSGGSR